MGGESEEWKERMRERRERKMKAVVDGNFLWGKSTLVWIQVLFI